MTQRESNEHRGRQQTLRSLERREAHRLLKAREYHILKTRVKVARRRYTSATTCRWLSLPRGCKKDDSFDWYHPPREGHNEEQTEVAHIAISVTGIAHSAVTIPGDGGDYVRAYYDTAASQTFLAPEVFDRVFDKSQVRPGKVLVKSASQKGDGGGTHVGRGAITVAGGNTEL